MLRYLPIFWLCAAFATAADCIAHRGDSIRRPDNSIAAIRSAWKAGADVVEVDVRMLKDGTLVLFHDADHVKESIKQFDHAAFNKRIGGKGVPTLKQGLMEVAAGKVLLLDLKEHSPEFLDRVLDEVAASTISGTRVELQATSFKGLKYLREKAPEGTPLYYVTSLKSGGKWTEAEALAKQLADMKLQGVTAKGRQMVDAEYVMAFRKRGLRYFVWTINDPARMKHYVELGVDGVITDDPVAFRKVVPTKPQAKKLPLPGEVFELEGRRAFLILPEKVDPQRTIPWVWYAPTLPGLPEKREVWMFKQWLDQGIAIAGIDVGESYGSPEGTKLYSALHQHLVSQWHLADKPCLLGRSRGGLMLYNWAVENPDKVSGIAGIYPVCNLASYPGLKRACGAYGMSAEELEKSLKDHNPPERLASLAKAGVPIFHLHGDNDKVVPLEENSGLVKERYDELGGEMALELIAGGGHDVKAHWFTSQKLVDFVSGVLVGKSDFRPIMAKRKAALDRITIPSVNLKGVTIQQAVSLAWSYAVELDPTTIDPKEKGVTISVLFPSGKTYCRGGSVKAFDDELDASISYQVRDVSLVTLLTEIAKQAGMDLYTTSSGVVLCPAETKPFPNGLSEEGEVWEQLYQVEKPK